MIPTFTRPLKVHLIPCRTKRTLQLDKYIDSLITIIGAAQEPDGYLYTFRTVNAKKPHEWIGDKRWVNEEILSHELYDCGHLYEAAVAHFRQPASARCSTSP
jgi:DUF1680 family protein